jgi:hypothetical protein
MHADDTDEPPDEADELRDIMELGRRDDFMSGSVPTKELRNFGAESEKKLSVSVGFDCVVSLVLPLPSCEKLIERSLI